MVNQQTETTATLHSPTDLDVENDDTETPTTCQRIKQSQTFQRIKKFIQTHSKCLQLIFFFTKETVDTTLDWLLFNELNTQDDGLVFGAVDSWLLRLLFTFCCIGTALTVLGISNRVHELRTGSPFMHAYIPEILTALLEDIPQLAIGYHILQCRGQTINSVARAKAGVLLFVSFLYFVYTIITMILHGHYRDNLEYWLKNVLFFTCVVIMTLSSTTLTSITIGRPNPAFDPFDILKNENKSDSYFSRVGIYVNTDDLEIDDLISKTTNWIKFFEVHDILGNDEITVQVTTDPSHVRLQTVYGPIQDNNMDICYRLNGTFEDEIFFTETTDCALSNGTKWHYRFKYIQPSMRYLLGDIQYNVRKTEIGSCDNIVVERVPDLEYFRERRNQNLTGHLYGPGPLSHYE